MRGWRGNESGLMASLPLPPGEGWGGGKRYDISDEQWKYAVCRGSPTASCFSCLAKKSNQKKSPPIHHLFEVPCIARLARLPHKLARSATRPRAQTYSSEFPDPPALLGGG